MNALATATVALQLAAGGAAVARVATNDYRRSRGWAIAAQTAIAGDYLLKSLTRPDAAYLVGLTYSLLVTARTSLVLFVPRLDRDPQARIIVCLLFLAATSSLMLVADIYRGARFSVITILPFIAAGFGAGTDISNHQPTRRWYILGLGLSQIVFASATQAWGLAAKSLISDIGASLYYQHRRCAVPPS